MFRNRIWLPLILIPVLFLIGCGLFSEHEVANVSVSSPRQEAVRHAVPPAVSDEGSVAAQPAVEVTQQLPRDGSHPALLASGVPAEMPEHLRFPAALREVYHSTRPLSAQEKHQLQHLFKEIVSNYNPGRSRAAVWPAFITAEKAYRVHAAQHLGEPLNATLGGSLYYWQYEQAWAFPEIMECFVAETDPEKISMFVMAHQIAMGDVSIDHNRVLLLDGREFHMRPNTAYVFRYNADDGILMTHRDQSVYTPGTPRPEVVIDVQNTSDADLERLRGWDFRINPITLQPFQVPRP